MMNRRRFLAAGALAAAGVALGGRLGAQQGKPSMVVYKSPTCGCCDKWVEHMQANGFAVTVKDMDDVSPIKARYKVGTRLQSCHTAVVGGYVVEGHVPAADVKRMLAQKPKFVGLTIPGMPQSAPGMDITPFQPYEVLSFDASGATAVYARHTK
jgi:hypothetical protein